MGACAKLFGIIAHGKENRMHYVKCRRSRKPKRAGVIWILKGISWWGQNLVGNPDGHTALGKTQLLTFLSLTM